MMTRDEAAALGSCTLKKKEGGLKAAVEMVIMIKMSIEKKHDQGDVVGALIRPAQIAELPRSKFDPELFPHSA